MEGRLFTLADATDHSGIFAWGIEITHGDEVEAVIYRRDPQTHQLTNGVHQSAETARTLYSRMVRPAHAARTARGLAGRLGRTGGRGRAGTPTLSLYRR